MKQYITGAQYNELNIEQKSKLNAFSQSPDHNSSSFCSIGFFLDFLQEYSKKEPIEVSCTSDGYWHVSIYSAKARYNGVVLIDQLWDAVKDILAKE